MKAGRFAGIMVVVWRLILAAVFIWAGVAKLATPEMFAEAVSGFRFFPEALVNGIAMTVPVLELLAGGLLIGPKTWRVGALLTGLMAACFAGLFAWAWWHGLDVKCSCFGAATGGSEHGVALGFGRAVGLLAASGFLYGVGIWRYRNSRNSV